MRRASVARYFNTDDFRAQAPGTLGTERSNQLYGPPSRHVDPSLFKNFSLHQETTLQFRAEVFNLTNTANFATPAAVLGGANFGQLTQMTGGYAPREIQFAFRRSFLVVSLGIEPEPQGLPVRRGSKEVPRFFETARG